MAIWNFTLSLGSNEEGQKRREAYEKAAKKDGVSLGEWIKSVLDVAAKIKFVKE